MKKIILSIAAVFAFGLANAQDVKYGAKAGLDNMSQNAGGTTVSASGFFVGGFAEYNLKGKIALQPGLNYHRISKDGASTASLSIPVIAKYNVADKINILAGPTLFYSLEETTEKTTFNLDLGGSYDITEKIFIEPRYSLGLTGLVKANHFLIGIGYKF